MASDKIVGMNRAERRRLARRRAHEQRAGERSSAGGGHAGRHGAAGRDAAGLAHQLEDLVAQLWDSGWQPADLLHALRRELTDDASEVLRAAIASQSRQYAEIGERVAPAWMAQLRAVGALPWWPEHRSFVEALGTDRVHRSVPPLTAALHALPRLPLVAPPPSRWHEGMAAPREPAGSVSDSVLAKVRALLAKAESTTFAEEADAFMTKAQELMTRYRIDRAMLHDDAGADADGPGRRRVLIDDPYGQPKYLLLAAVAGANTVRAVWSSGFGFATIVGYPTDLDVVEELFTSLLVQATSAMAREGSKVDARGRSRTRRFRKAFLVAYAHRIGQRLADATDATVHEAEAEYGTALVPVLAARDEQVRRATDEAFPELGSMRVSATDAEGWAAGTTHADLADLSAGAPLRR